jgi:hypothetical protein
LTYEVRGGFSGLLTNVAETRAPGTALRLAENVVIRQPGAVEPRQGFEDYAADYSLTGYDLTQGEVHGDDMVLETTGYWRAADGTARSIRLWPNETPIAVEKYRDDSFSVALARGNMYLPHGSGVAVANSADATRWYTAGLSMNYAVTAPSISSTHTGEPGLPPGFQWSYRCVLKRTDSNGLIVRSVPTGAMNVKNESATDYAVITLPMRFVFWDSSDWDSLANEIEVYRTRAFPNALTVDDEMALVTTLTIEGDSIVVPAGVFEEYLDTVADEARGAALYTSPSREGFEGQNDPPPACACVEPYRGHLFFGDCAGPQRILVSHAMSDRTGLADGVGWRNVTGTATALSATITVSDATGLEKGMTRIVSGGIITGHITNISGTTLTMNIVQASGLGAGIAMTFTDAIEVDGEWVPLTTNDGSGYEMIDQTNFDTFLNYLHGGKYSGYRVTPPVVGLEHTHMIEQTARNGSAFTMRATHGKEMVPPLPLYGDDPLMSKNDVYPNMLMWSKQEEPEHVAPANYALIGEKTKRILALAHTRDSLFILKEDGIWRLSGYAGQWSIDPFDVTTFCILPSSVKRLNNRVFALTNRGVVSISELGAEPLSFPVADQMRKIIDDVRENLAAFGHYQLSGVDGVAATVDDRNGEYLLMLGNASLDLNGAQLAVYNEISTSWTTFSFEAAGTSGFAPQALSLAPGHAPLILHNGGMKVSSYATETTLGQTTRRMYDGASVTVTVSSSVLTTATTATVTISAPRTFVAGRDVLTDSAGTAFDITSITSTTIFVVTVPDGMGAPATGAGSVRRGFLCVVQPHGFMANQQVGKHWNGLEVGFSRLLGTVKLVATFSSAQPLVTEDEQDQDQEFVFYRVSGVAAHHLGTMARIAAIPVNHARSWLLRVRLSWLAVRGLVSLELMQLDARTVAPTRPQQSSSGIT